MSVYYRNLFYEYWNKNKVGRGHLKFPNTVSMDDAVEALRSNISDERFSGPFLTDPTVYTGDTTDSVSIDKCNRLWHKSCYVHMYGCIRNTDFIHYPYVNSYNYDRYTHVGAMQKIIDSVK
jgi:hypothetical protein